MHEDAFSHLHPGGAAFNPDLIDARGRLARLHKGGPSQSQINAQKKQAKRQEELLMRQIRAQEQASKAALAAMEAPAVAAPNLAPPPPTQTSSSSDMLASERDMAQQTKRRRGLAMTRVAGETGGYLGGSPSSLGTSGGSTLLAS